MVGMSPDSDQGGGVTGEGAQLRSFCDVDGQQWEVRAIRPTPADRRAPLVAADLANGWLLFTLGLERRRLAPLPPGWDRAPDSQLLRWCGEAKTVGTARDQRD